MQTKTNAPFNNDRDKMRDFYTQSKEEFLQTYSYISSESYDMTARKIKREAKQALALLARIAEESGQYGEAKETEQKAIETLKVFINNK